MGSGLQSYSCWSLLNSLHGILDLMDTALGEHRQEIVRLHIATGPWTVEGSDRKQDGTLPVDSILLHRCRTDYETAGEITKELTQTATQ